eukprot:TRINITY_DN2907_c0_g1_i5.p1 TRINITY_DN2907_c0_g1~~TRINITY_DN2907_c0_g1_i5.p1  ORF type:complete len:613 (+),score=160.32 TRINITY_DN2907_c0_g1_i5:202-1839(+)
MVGKFWQWASTLRLEEGAAAQQFERLTETAAGLLDEPAAAVLALSLASRSYSPTVEMFRQLERSEKAQLPAEQATKVMPGRPFAVVQGAQPVVVVDETQLAEAIAQAKSSVPAPVVVPLFEFDHRYGPNCDTCVTVVLYAHLGTTAFHRFHDVLSRMNGVNYVLRHSFDAESGNGVVGGLPTPMFLSGYGVEFALKSVEYKAIDDAATPKTTEAEEEVSVPTGVEDAPTVQPLDENDRFDEMTKTEIAALGHAAMTYVASSPDPLAALRYLSGGFPSFAVSLSKFRRNSTLVKQLFANQKFIAPEANTLLLNGRTLDPAEVDLFTLEDVLKEELLRLQQLRGIGLPLPVALHLLEEPLPPDQTHTLRFDLRSSSDAITYANNLETDMMYNRFYRSVNDIMRPTFGQFPYIAKNFFTTVVALNPSSSEGLDVARTLHFFLNQMVPMRVGIILATTGNRNGGGCTAGGDCAVSASPSVGVAVARVFHLFARTHGNGRLALFFLSQVAEFFEESHQGDVTLAHVEQAFFELFSFSQVARQPPHVGAVR